jgi:hypothetical protein
MVEDYTNAFLVSALALCLLILATIWAVWGFAAAVFVGWAADRVIVFEALRAAARR